MSLQIAGTIQLPAERRPFVNGVSSDPVELPYDATEWGQVQKLLTWNDLAGLFDEGQLASDPEPVRTAVEGLHVTILGQYQGQDVTLHGGTYRVDCILDLMARPKIEKCEPFGDTETSPYIVFNAWVGSAILSLSLYKPHCVIPTADGMELEAEAPEGVIQAVFWLGKPHSNTIAQTTRRRLKELRRKFTAAGTDALGMAAAYAEVLAFRDDADEAKEAAKKVKKDLATPLLSAMTRGGKETKRITTGGRTLSVSANVYAGRAVEIFEDTAAITALKADKGDHLIKESIAAQSWKKYVRDSVRDDDNELPKTDRELAERITANLPNLAPFLAQIVRVFYELNDCRA